MEIEFEKNKRQQQKKNIWRWKLIMDKNISDLWPFCFAKPLSDMVSLVITTAPFGNISDNFHAFLQQKNWQREKTD